jgi:hypothetical protein
VLAVTEDTAAVRAYLRTEKYTFPAYVDVEGDAARAFDNRTSPRYFVLDRAGRIRFESSRPDDVLRQVESLRGAP